MTAADLQKILLVEDEPDIQAVAKVALESVGGFDVELCGSGEQCLQRAPVWGPDLILLDVMMPGMDGPTTLQALQENDKTSSIPIIFMTAKVQASEIAQSKALGAWDVIAKPFDPMTLADTVRAIWNKNQT